MFDYDPELPAGFQDADFEMRELEELGNRAHWLRTHGKCPHGSWVGYHPEYPERNLSANEVRCTDGCNKVFLSEDEILDAHREVMG